MKKSSVSDFELNEPKNRVEKKKEIKWEMWDG